MKLIVEFDIDADLIDVPESVIVQREALRRRFLKWLYDPGVKHRWRVKGKDFDVCCYRSDAFVEWLNKKILGGSDRAVILREHLHEWDDSLPSIFF